MCGSKLLLFLMIFGHVSSSNLSDICQDDWCRYEAALLEGDLWALYSNYVTGALSFVIIYYRVNKGSSLS